MTQRPTNSFPDVAGAPGFDDILAAAARIAPHARVTPVLHSRSLDAIAGCELHFKAEPLQRIGAFKFRGAANAVFGLDDETAARGVVTQSSGNHGAAIALACRLRGIPAHVVAPSNTPRIKLDAIRDFGATLVSCEPTLAARDATSARVLAETGGELVHPYNDARVIAGQGTAALELLHDVRGIDALIAPVSGGGLLSGTAIAAHGLDASIDVIGAEPEQAADAHASLARGERVTDMTPDTICDGLRAQLGTLTFPILKAHCARIDLASEAEIVRAMRLIWERLKLVVEPSAAVPLAVILRERQRFAGRRVGVILSGGNVDLDALPGMYALAR
ncbi:pyridoxal-phosphate dependent enzyme [Cognatilysobacter bugurensis]|uniref:Serine/threonine dehydratase n=1 Tax=Cognatilysobacter bugurensis TaxID=543356 RepID=A0A918T484_9GAMM|nr:pyridoxal-phosphate dependent enzyme [Lysobacter bugurensis]GHA87968.1 serine/threonine dehydratase [Lysobacter bugurensis]